MDADAGEVHLAADEPRRPLGSARGVDDTVPPPRELDAEVVDEHGPEAIRLLDRDPVQLVVVGGAERALEARQIRPLNQLWRRVPNEFARAHVCGTLARCANLAPTNLVDTNREHE